MDLAVIELVSLGFAFDAILDMDVVAFDCLVARAARLEADRRVGRLFADHVAAQGDSKAVKRFAKALRGEDVSGPQSGRPEAVRNDSARLVQSLRDTGRSA